MRALASNLIRTLLTTAALAGCDTELDHEVEDTLAGEDEAIVGGTVAAAGEFPFATFVRMSGPSGTFSCTGSLVTPTLVMTAAHCIYDSSRPGQSLPGDVTVTLGRVRMSDTSTGEVISTSEIIKHPWYPGGEGSDVAFLRLSRASVQTPVPIASAYGPSDRALWFPGVNAVTIGWGRTSEGGPSSDDLRKVTVPILPDATVERSDWYGSSFDRRTMLGAGYEAGGKDSCNGDSGGPLLVPSRSGWKVAGVTSWGIGCARVKRPGVYTRISALRTYRWIKAVVHETPHVGDVNGDNRADIVTFTHGDSGYGPLDVYVALSNGTSFGAASVWADWWAHRFHLPMLGDFNGDGRQDIFAFTEVGDVWVALSNGSSFNGGTYHSGVIMDVNDVPAVGDVDGDGRDDILVFTADGTADVHVVRSTGTGFGGKTKWHDFFGLEGETIEVADVNADGRDDIITFNQGVNGNNAWVALSTGSSFAASSVWHSYFAPVEEMPGVGDVDGDGDADLVTFTRDPWARVYVGLSNRLSSFSAVLWKSSFGGPAGTYRVGDVNGDGRDDVIRFTQDTAADVFVARSTGAAFGAESLWHGYFAP